MKPIDSKLPTVGTTIFTVMSRLAEQHGAVNLSQGFPDFQPPEGLIERVEEQLHARCHQYAPMPGSVPLRAAIAAKLRDLYGVAADPDGEITVTSGATEAIFGAIQAVVRRDDEVIVLDPCYDSYEPSITLAGGRAVHLPLTLPHFGVDWERLQSALSERTRLVIVNTPHNPSGALLSSADFDRLAELLRPYDCYLLSDEVYEHVVFDGRRHATALTQPELRERAFAVFSFGKTYHATGWKLGYCVAPPELTAELRRVHQYVTFASTSPLQLALAQYMTEHPEHHLELPAFYQERRDYFLRLLERTRFRARPAAGTYFQLADYSEISDLPDVEFARRLTIEHGVAVIPISV
ncbi:MAG TPA: methionine aminotransferase, partial [Gammaproteobacteria bacterium]|nr:methionine aminotransferase [Gammaproteobacteria bacterium]